MKNKVAIVMGLMIGSVSILANASALFNQYSYQAAAQAHAAAPGISFEQVKELIGRYRMIATASKSYRGEFAKKEMNGIANPDQSILTLDFSDSANGVGVLQMNLGKFGQNQGPSAPEFRSDGAFAFLQYSYKNGAISNSVYFSSECKRLADAMLLCAKRFIVNDFSQVNAQQAAMHNTIVGFDLYSK